MKRILLLAIGNSLLFMCGCQYLENRVSDLSDIFRLEGRGGFGFDVGVKAGPVLHLGFGFNTSDSFGWYYGEYIEHRAGVVYLPLSLFPDYGHGSLHQELIYEAVKRTPEHYCYAIFPSTVITNDPAPAIRAFDIEVDVFLAMVGVKAGISPGEILDFLLGIFTIDIAKDDKQMGKQEKKDKETDLQK